MRQTTSGTNIIRTSVILSDWIILNILLGIFINYIPNITPYYFTAATKISVLATNMAFGIAQYFFFTIIHVRQIHFDQVLHRVLKLSITQLILTFTFLQFLCPSESFLSFSIIAVMMEFCPTMTRSSFARVTAVYRRFLYCSFFGTSATERITQSNSDP